MQFNLIVTGLDSIAARRWINATLVNMVDMENEESLKPLIDGGTEGMPKRGVKLTDRLQGTGACDPADRHFLLRVLCMYTHCEQAPH